MKTKRLFAFLFPLLTSFPAVAIGVGDVTSIMSPDETHLAKEIFNNTDSARFVNVRIERLSSPMEGGVIIPMESKSELLSTPANLILPGQSKEYFRFIYDGPSDDKERYYRLSWSDEPIAEYESTKKSKLGQATTSAIIGTIFVVAPRKEHFDFKREGDTVTNTGNASFRVISYGPCRDKSQDQGKGCRERYYLMPNVSVKIKHTDLSSKRTHVGIWHGEKLITANAG